MKTSEMIVRLRETLYAMGDRDLTEEDRTSVMDILREWRDTNGPIDRPIPGKVIERQVTDEYDIVTYEPAGFQAVGSTILETRCVGECPMEYRIDPEHPDYERVKAGLDRKDRSVLFCYHKHHAKMGIR